MRLHGGAAAPKDDTLFPTVVLRGFKVILGAPTVACFANDRHGPLGSFVASKSPSLPRRNDQRGRARCSDDKNDAFRRTPVWIRKAPEFDLGRFGKQGHR